MSDYRFSQLDDEEGKPYVVRRNGVDARLGFVWRAREGAGVDGTDGVGPLRWEAIVAETGERSGLAFSTRAQAADWLFGRWSVTEGPAAKYVPDDPYAGLDGS